MSRCGSTFSICFTSGCSDWKTKCRLTQSLQDKCTLLHLLMTLYRLKMGKLKCFVIILTGNKSVFHPGEKVCGKVVVDLKGDMKMRSLRIFMRGVAKVHWTESRSTGSRLGSYTEHYNAEVEYFFKRQVLFGGGIHFIDHCVLIYRSVHSVLYILKIIYLICILYIVKGKQ